MEAQRPNYEEMIREKLRQAIFSGSAGQQTHMLDMIIANWSTLSAEIKSFIHDEVENYAFGGSERVHLLDLPRWNKLRALAA